MKIKFPDLESNQTLFSVIFTLYQKGDPEE